MILVKFFRVNMALLRKSPRLRADIAYALVAMGKFINNETSGADRTRNSSLAALYT